MSTHKTSLPKLSGVALGSTRPVSRAVPDAETLVDKALKRAGRGKFSDPSFIGPLNVLLKAYAEEADLSFFGRYATRFDLERCLTNLLRLDMAEEENPLSLPVPFEGLSSSPACREAPAHFYTC